MAIDPSALKADIIGRPETLALWDAGANGAIVVFYSQAGAQATQPLATSELRNKLRTSSVTLSLYEVLENAAATKEAKAAVRLFLKFADDSEQITVTDTAFVAAVNSMEAEGVITAGQKTGIQNMFLQDQTLGEELFGAKVTKNDVREAREV